MRWQLKDDDGYAALLFDDKLIIASVRTHTLADKTRAQLMAAAPEMLAVCETAERWLTANLRLVAEQGGGRN